jgi:hypothetical protein
MKREKVNLIEERNILINMIMDTDFLQQIIVLIKPALFQSGYAKTVARWIMEYFEKYKEAPGKNISDIYRQKSISLQDEDEHEMLSEFLLRLDKEAVAYALKNVAFSVAEAVKYLKLRSLELLQEDIASALLEANPALGEQAVANYSRIEPLKGEGISIFQDAISVMKAFMREEEVLFSFPGALGRVVGEFTRGSFVAWLGFMKRGKTWWLWYCAEQAAFAGCKVLFVTLEMQWWEIIRRGWEGLVGNPKVEKEVTIPYFNPVGTKWEIEYKQVKKSAVDVSTIAKQQKKLQNLVRAGDIRTEAFPTYSVAVEDIIAHLDNLQYYDGFIPDVLVLDYADILRPTGGGKEYRHQLNDIWMKLRGLAQARNISVITASQAVRKGFKNDVDVDDTAEDVRKLGHVTKMLVINRNREEKKKGIFRISNGLERNEGQEYQQGVVLECLDIGRPCLDSRLFNEVIFEKQGEE